jgi:hypothetical protein
MPGRRLLLPLLAYGALGVIALSRGARTVPACTRHTSLAERKPGAHANDRPCE